MSTHNSNNTDTSNAAEPDSPVAFDIESLSPRQQRVVLVCDVVESVRWMEDDEDNAITRWSQFATAVRSRIAPAHGGEVIKSTGDGLMMQFQAAPGAVAAANAMQKIASEGNQGYAPERQMHLRIGIHQTQARRDAHDLYGHGVNLAARITTLAGPGEIIVTPEVRDHLTDSLDGEIEDMGECYLKHLSEPQRVYRVGSVSEQPILSPERDYSDVLQPTIAVIPFDSRSKLPEYFAVGDLIADCIISELGKSAYLKIISRLSTTAFNGVNKTTSEIGRILKANYLVAGSYLIIGSGENTRLILTVELIDTHKDSIVWADRFNGSIKDLLSIESECITHIVKSVSAFINNHETQKADTNPLPTLSAFSLQLSGINLTHRANIKDFEKGHQILTELTQRHRRAVVAHAWLAKWHVMRVIRGLSTNPQRDTQIALECCSRALEINSQNSLALAIYGYVLCQIAGDIAKAENSIDLAIQLNPNDMHARLFRSVLSAHTGENQRGVEEALLAIKLSPTDPHRYFMNTILASAYAFNCEYSSAITYADQALRLDATHAPALRAKLLAQIESEDVDGAKITLNRLRVINPALSIKQYRAMGSHGSPARQRVIYALQKAGLPETV